MDTTNNDGHKSGIALIVMGPSACGKSEVALALSKHYKCEYLDADFLHPQSNIEKMSNSIPLTDDNRFPWLKLVRERLVTLYRNSITTTKVDNNTENVRVVVACSSLKRVYRDILRGSYAGFEDKFNVVIRTTFVFLNCSESTLAERINRREGHFMKANMLQSQLATLEKPNADEGAIVVNGDQSFPLVISYVTENLGNVNY